jgi:hypothetical protein
MVSTEIVSEPSDMDVAYQTILAATAHNDARDPYAPVLETLTYDLETISDFGTPAEFRLEMSQVEQYVIASLMSFKSYRSHE